jgi:5-methyltetrahydropteroyltriglutamate--homocysteine methyltransferase
VFNATDEVVLPTSVIGSLPRPSWYDENLGTRDFRAAMISTRFREQYTDAVSCFIRDQETAGLDIVTDGDARFDMDVGGHSWFSYPATRMSGTSGAHAFVTTGDRSGLTSVRGEILHEVLEARIMPDIVGPVGPGDLQYTAIWKSAQRLTPRPVKFGTITPELLALAMRDFHYGNDIRECIWAFSDALNAELTQLADAGCRVIQLEEPQIHLLAAKGLSDDVLNPEYLVEVFANTVRGLRDKTEIWCHTCWGNPAQQRLFAEQPSYRPALEALDSLDADVVTFECCSTGGADLDAIGKVISADKKVCIGVIDHHSLQVERPEQVAELIRHALEHIPAERLVISSDCGMGREGMSRRHAYNKMVAMVRGTNLVRRELGLPEAESLATEDRYSLVETE